MGPETEAELLARCRRGEAAAWDELFDRHYAAAGRFIFQLSPDFSREDTEEICQEVFLSVIKNLDSFMVKASFRPGCSGSQPIRRGIIGSGSGRPNAGAGRPRFHCKPKTRRMAWCWTHQAPRQRRM